MKNIIFDIDGTLWDSTDVVADSWNEAILVNTGVEAKLTGDRLKQLFGRTMEEIGRILLPDLDDEKRAQVCQACYDYEDAYLEKQSGVFYDGVTDTLKALAKDYNLYVVSNCQLGYIETTLKYAKLTDVVKDHLCYGDTGLHKGETIKLLMQKNQIDQAIYVGDTQGDFEACEMAGIPMIFASYGFGKVENPAYILNDIKELPALMKRINEN